MSKGPRTLALSIPTATRRTHLVRLLPIAVATLFLSAVGCADPDVRIGAIISETGNSSEYGQSVRRGLDLAVEELNAAGGIAGKPVVLEYRDDHTQAEHGEAAFRELVDSGVEVIIGAVSSPVTIALGELAEAEEILLMSPTASAPEITRFQNWVYRVYPSDMLEGTQMADFASDLGLERIVVFAVDDAFGAGLRDVFSARYPSKYREILQVFEFTSGDRASIDAMVATTNDLDPQGIYIAAYWQDLATILESLEAAGVEAVKLGTSAFRPSVIDGAGSATEHLMYPQPAFDLESEDAALRAFIEAYRAKYDDDPERWAAYGYDSLKLIARGMEQAGNARKDSAVTGLNNTSNYEGASGRISIDGNGDVVQYPRIFIVVDGESIQYNHFIEQGGSLDTSN